jgi:hypothetical protein
MILLRYKTVASSWYFCLQTSEKKFLDNIIMDSYISEFVKPLYITEF